LSAWAERIANSRCQWRSSIITHSGAAASVSAGKKATSRPGTASFSWGPMSSCDQVGGSPSPGDPTTTPDPCRSISLRSRFPSTESEVPGPVNFVLAMSSWSTPRCRTANWVGESMLVGSLPSSSPSVRSASRVSSLAAARMASIEWPRAVVGMAVMPGSDLP